MLMLTKENYILFMDHACNSTPSHFAKFTLTFIKLMTTHTALLTLALRFLVSLPIYLNDSILKFFTSNPNRLFKRELSKPLYLDNILLL